MPTCTYNVAVANDDNDDGTVLVSLGSIESKISPQRRKVKLVYALFAACGSDASYG